MNILLNEAEQEALMLCSHEAMRLYVLLLRPRMDAKTGMVGGQSRISRGWLAAQMVYEPPRGSHRPIYAPTIKQIRGLVDELERIGLLHNLSKSDQVDKRLIFWLPLAVGGLSRPAEEGPMKGLGDGHNQTRANTGFGGIGGPMIAAHDGPKSGVSGIPVLSSGSSHLIDTGDQSKANRHRSIEIAKLLAGLGVRVDPLLLQQPAWATALLRPDVDWLAVVAKAQFRKPQGFHVNYLLPLFADVLQQSATKPWFMCWSGIERKALELGLVQAVGEPGYVFTERVQRAAGVTRDMLRAAEIDGQKRAA
jgi:hypothetical protein